MIYHQKYLTIKILFESLREQTIRGFYRPHAYIDGKTKYGTECQIDIIKEDIKKGDQIVLTAVLLAPVGFGEHLKEGSLLTLKNGVYVEGKAIVLAIVS